MRSPADGQALRDKVPGVMPAFAKAADAVGRLHYCRLIAPDATTFLFIAEYDGELEAILRAMATELGPVMDDIFSHVEAPPPMPVARNPTPSSTGQSSIRSAPSRSMRTVRA